MSSKEFHHLQDPLDNRKVPHVHLKIILTWVHLSALRNALWRMSNHGTAAPPGNYYTPSSTQPWLQTQGPHHTQQNRAVGAKLMRSPVGVLADTGWDTWIFQHGFDGCKAVGLMCLTPLAKGRRFLLKRNYTCLCSMKRLKIPKTCRLRAPTCLYSCDSWVTAAQPRNTRQKMPSITCSWAWLCALCFGSQGKEDLEHAKFKVNSRETSEATSCCWERPCNSFLFVPVLHGLLFTGWRLYTTGTVGFICRYGTEQETAKHWSVFCTKTQ